MEESFARLAGGGPDHARDRRALRHRAGARQTCSCRRYPTPDGSEPAEYLRRLTAGGPARALRRPAARRGRRAARDRAGRDREDGLRVVLPDRVGLRQVREGQRHRGRARARLGGRLDRQLRAAHHRRRPARLRPDVRALPEPRAQVDAGHRHRLLDPRPRARDPLRAGEVRRGLGRPDHHLRQDEAARRDARRGARAGARLRDRRPAREADPGADHGPQPELRGLPGRGQRAAQGLRLRAAGAADRRRRARARGHRAQQLDPRRRGRDRRPPADRDRAAPARRGPRRGRTPTATARTATASPSASTRRSRSTRWARSRRSAC